MKQFRPPVKPARPPAPSSDDAPSKPEENAEPEEAGSNLWQLFTAVPRPHRSVPLPRKLPGTNMPVGEVPMWPLLHGELKDSNAAAEQAMKRAFKDGQKKDDLNLGYSASFANEVAIQQLWRACRDPENLLKPAFPSPKSMSLNMTGDEVGVLYNHYLTIQSELGPIISFLSDEEFEALVLKIAEDGNSDPFDSLSWDLQRSLVVSLASQLASFWTATISAGSPPDESPGSESENENESDNPTAIAGVDSEPA